MKILEAKKAEETTNSENKKVTGGYGFFTKADAAARELGFIVNHYALKRDTYYYNDKKVNKNFAKSMGEEYIKRSSALHDEILFHIESNGLTPWSDSEIWERANELAKKEVLEKINETVEKSGYV